MIETPEPPHLAHQETPAEKSRHWLDRAMPVAIILLSVASLLVAWHTGQTMNALVQQNERMVRASSTPILAFDHGNLDDETRSPALKFTATNVGSGPARVVWMEMRYKGKPVENIGELIMRLAPGTDLAKVKEKMRSGELSFSTSHIGKKMLTEKDSSSLLNWPKPKDPFLRVFWESIDKARWQLEVESCYCSLFNECWTSNMQGDVPKPVTSCDAKGKIDLDG